MTFAQRLGRSMLAFGIPVFILSVGCSWKDDGLFSLVGGFLEALGGSFFFALIEHAFKSRKSS
jgi:hypothetical protein